MKTFILASLLALTAVSGVVVASQPAAAGTAPRITGGPSQLPLLPPISSVRTYNPPPPEMGRRKPQPPPDPDAVSNQVHHGVGPLPAAGASRASEPMLLTHRAAA